MSPIPRSQRQSISQTEQVWRHITLLACFGPYAWCTTRRAVNYKFVVAEWACACSVVVAGCVGARRSCGERAGR